MPEPRPDEKVLVVAPLGEDAATLASTLSSRGILTTACSDPAAALRQLPSGAGALLLTEEALELPGAFELVDALKAQPPWSELPLIILTTGGESRQEALLELVGAAIGSATLLERPMRIPTLLRSIQVALQSRRRQYQLRDLLAEQQRQQQALMESRERLRLAATAARLYAFEWNPLTDAVRREGPGSDILGVPFQEETALTFFQRIHPDDRAPLMQLARSLTFSSPSYSTSYRVLRPDGVEVVLEESARAFFDDQGRFVRLIGMSADVTQRKRAEEALRQSEAKAQARADEVMALMDAPASGPC